MLRVMVCELDGDAEGFERRWDAVVSHARSTAAELVLLPEMPFAPWLPVSGAVATGVWNDAVHAHETWVGRLGELGAAVVATSRPVTDETGRRFNEGIVWTAEDGVVATHRKAYLPDEPGFHEARWYGRGPTEFEAIPTPLGRVGFLICSELWFLEHARGYAEQDVDILLVPRATPAEGWSRWIAAGRVAAVCAGAFCLSSNRAGSAGEVTFAGRAWVTDPEGEPLARTSPAAPTATVKIDVDVARAAKSTYPRYVES